MRPQSTLILGAVRSGKSRLAERLAQASGLDVTYLATAEHRQDDAEMSARIDAHRSRRPAHWRTLEEPLHLAAALREDAAASRCIVVDCLTLWLSNLLCSEDPALLESSCKALLACIEHLPGKVILVANETGLGVVPINALSRRFVDQAGVLHQGLAERCEQVIFTVAGLPQILKGAPL